MLLLGALGAAGLGMLAGRGLEVPGSAAQAQAASSAATGEQAQSAGSELRLYGSFAEVRTPVTTGETQLSYAWPETAWEGMVPGSLDLEGLPYTRAVHAVAAPWLEGYEGQTVTLHEEGRASRVTLVRARDGLIRDRRGDYRQVPLAQLAVPDMPPLNSQGLESGGQTTTTFDLPAPGSGTLAYLTHALRWAPRYTLTLGPEGTPPQLSALADLHNGSDLAYQVQSTELLAGDVGLELGPSTPVMGHTAQATSAAAETGRAAYDIAALGSLNGIYRYALDQPFELPAGSTVTLPFMEPKLSNFESYAGLNTGFSGQSSKGVLGRFYRFKAAQALPGGTLTVREQGRLAGQTRVSETAAGQPVEFSLGRDPDLSYDRTVKKGDVVPEGKAKRVTYTVTYRLRNARPQPVRAEVTEQVYGDTRVSGDAELQGGRVRLVAEVPAGGEVTRTFTVKVLQ
ncbi:hypothetical protein GCM10017783_14570 [Deinococcus piscis]|uniref:DUF4139 domain-containing protein n=2 Tax=Deinococcus piscis TaxID=394230 RepID=A0ABQ3K4B8_9DEIO|nr:hypothetical protein GCM10017783_14570 [Deinococcus piscis]